MKDMSCTNDAGMAREAADLKKVTAGTAKMDPNPKTGAPIPGVTPAKSNTPPFKSGKQ